MSKTRFEAVAERLQQTCREEGTGFWLVDVSMHGKNYLLRLASSQCELAVHGAVELCGGTCVPVTEKSLLFSLLAAFIFQYIENLR